MIAQTETSKVYNLNHAKVLTLKKMRSATNLLSPNSNPKDTNIEEKLHQKESSVKNLNEINKSRLSKKTKDASSQKNIIVFDDLKQLMGRHIEENARNINLIGDEKQRAFIVEEIEKMKSKQIWQEYLSSYFSCEESITQIMLAHEHNIYRYNTNTNQKRMILVSGQKRQSKLKKYELIEQEKDELKRQLGKCKSKIAELQKKILKIVQQYRERKQIYLKEIDKLTKLVSTSIKEIPELFAHQKKHSKNINTKDSQIAITVSPDYRIHKHHLLSQSNDKLNMYFSNISAISNRHNPENREEYGFKLPAFSTIPL